ncbi:MAG: rRNA (adenine1518-N6/adenine1519-N6)-dimethyltransferase, partial [Actinomycetota bacterium]|nr:rRNA (adenine1518-N6/adenine1519-N6)-dimethyltransferase [Actinomycetota bacterium]
ARLLDEVPAIGVLSVMVQKEVAERLAAPPGTPACGAISVKVAYHARAAVVGIVPPTVFVPRPKVDSAVVRFERRASPPVEVPSADALFTLARAGFGQRRKTLRQALRPVLGPRAEEVLTAAGIPSLTRAEALTLDQWAALTRAADPPAWRGPAGGAS